MRVFLASLLLVSTVLAAPLAPTNLRVGTDPVINPPEQWISGFTVDGHPIVDSGTGGVINFTQSQGDWYKTCSTIGSCTPCDLVVYDQVKDGYDGLPIGQNNCLTESDGCSGWNTDFRQIWYDKGRRHVLYKNNVYKNQPEGGGSVSEPHVDLIQIFGATDYSGWIVLQNVELRNSDDQGLLGSINRPGVGTSSTACGEENWYSGGFLMQDVRFIKDTGFYNDCLARSAISPWNDSCFSGHRIGSEYTRVDGWFIDIEVTGGNQSFTVGKSWRSVIMINSPNIQIDNGGGANQFSVSNAHPTDPDGIWRYNSIEEALADGHPEPPFIRLNCTGWANTSNCTNG